jgi:hypothetical protein
MGNCAPKKDPQAVGELEAQGNKRREEEKKAEAIEAE